MMRRCWEDDFSMLDVSPHDGITVGQSFSNIGVFGRNGGGKTTGSIQALTGSMISADYGILYLPVKPGDYARILKMAQARGRGDNVIRFAPDERKPDGSLRWQFNWMGYLQKRPQRGVGKTQNITHALMTVNKALDRGGANSVNEHFWRATQAEALRNSIDLQLLARPDEALTLRRLYDIILSGPRTLEEATSERWETTSLCNLLACEAMARQEQMTPQERRDFELTGNYWYTLFPQMPWETRGSIIAGITSLMDGLLRGPMGEMFSTGLNIVPEIVHEGAILVIDTPQKTFRSLGTAAQTIFELLFEEATEMRDVGRNPRPIASVIDEAHLLINEDSISFATTAREARACCLWASQSLPNYHSALGGGEKGRDHTAQMTAVMGTFFLHNNACSVTNRWASDYFAKSWQPKGSFGRSDDQMGKGTKTSGFQFNLEDEVLPAEFLQLRSGGPANNLLVDAIVGQSGRIWKASGKTYLKTTFKQEAL